MKRKWNHYLNCPEPPEPVAQHTPCDPLTPYASIFDRFRGGTEWFHHYLALGSPCRFQRGGRGFPASPHGSEYPVRRHGKIRYSFRSPSGGGTIRFRRDTGQIPTPMASGDHMELSKPVVPVIPGHWRGGSTFVSSVTICDPQ